MTLPAIAAPSETRSLALPEPLDATAPVALEGEILTERNTSPGTALALWNVLERLEQALDRETSELRALKTADLNRMNETKSRLLLDVSRAVRAVREDIADERLLARLSSLRLKLEHNRLAIAMHLDAVREIAGAMAATLIDAESDGTYSARMSAQLAPQLARVSGR
ncbi:hypothetical protein DWF00_10735 [Bosea caraganae]|uniref:Flagellar protein FlgN n=1 Tax=Bosea caraganae TaxID=2763117 RepID=A0A370LC19_9HYPH|nr:hypothetical protein [Bosea caraganae]RDJ27425.1 hypothetical protein DWF00_10735 [Bosea caraganae]RDJ29441.1 hypothetical protein DWE98_02505 [Bosea caraganae]